MTRRRKQGRGARHNARQRARRESRRREEVDQAGRLLVRALLDPDVAPAVAVGALLDLQRGRPMDPGFVDVLIDRLPPPRARALADAGLAAHPGSVPALSFAALVAIVVGDALVLAEEGGDVLPSPPCPCGSGGPRKQCGRPAEEAALARF